MERLNKSFEYDAVMQDDELEARKKAAEHNKNEKKRKKKLMRFLILLILVLLFLIYMLSGYSNIRVIDINGNHFYTKEQLLDKANIDYSMKSVFAPSFLISSRLEKDPLLKKVKVKKTIDGVVRIDVEEENMIGYYKEKNKVYLMLKEGEDIICEDPSVLAYIPYLNSLNKTQRKEYKKNIFDVEDENILMISEVVHHETSYDKNMLKVIMQDGHVVISRFEGLYLLNNYLEMLKGLNTTHKCIVFVEETNSSYSEKCE